MESYSKLERNEYKNGSAKELLKASYSWPVLYHISDIRENIVDWYPFEKDSDGFYYCKMIKES